FDRIAAGRASRAALEARGATGPPLDAMKALEQSVVIPTVDPVAALGLLNRAAAATKPAPPAAAAFAQAAGSTTVKPQMPVLPGSGEATGRRYSGSPISLDFQGADLRSVLRVFSEV